MMVVRAVLLTLLALLLGTAPGWAGPSDQALKLINADRERNGRPAITPDTILTEAAAEHLELMARIGEITLQERGRPSVLERARRDGSQLLQLRAFVQTAAPTPERIVSSLKQRNDWHLLMRDPAIDRIGIAYDPDRFLLDNGAQTGQVWVIILGNSRARIIPNAETNLVTETNRARRSRGLGALTENPVLSAAALAHARDMAARGYFAHESPDGGSVVTRVERQGYNYRQVGENLAVGQTSAEEVIQGWTDSPGHAANLYGKDYTEVGVGYVPGPLSLNGEPTSQVWVSVYGRPR
jgi:uncharacterized protein YkwD